MRVDSPWDRGEPEWRGEAGQNRRETGTTGAPCETGAIREIQNKLAELSMQHEQAMRAMSSNVNKSYVYVPRERQITPFSGDPAKDGRSVEEFIEEVARVVRARGQNTGDQIDFVLSLLRGSALEEVRLCTGGEPDDVSELFTLLREAFAEKRTVAQLLQAFYGRRQRENETLQEYSHALSQVLRLALKQRTDAVSDARVAVRDQFIEGVRDVSLKRELRRMVRDRPRCTLLEVREEAIAWSLEDQRDTKVAQTKQVVCDSIRKEGLGTGTLQEKPEVSLEDIVKMVSEQSKAIGELTIALKEGMGQKDRTYRDWGGRPRPKPQFTDDGKPICFKCKEPGHISRECPQRKAGSQVTATSASLPGN